ncbi:uncharacterized protein CLUP02_02515 [Colletotrichum lupini]|uniref:Uncharacterized protein n=1 Tax=Colletotrichum lupini TaxID=145971 RepID=A0A9Q8WBC1_9PEZI|nr:uncharacterized protein CLUP02_02515 [Colletotrichum lupini]UQC77049.1 hypothetical protein CLUP02_02515 [Colletotrichum lupini]
MIKYNTGLLLPNRFHSASTHRDRHTHTKASLETLSLASLVAGWPMETRWSHAERLHHALVVRFGSRPATGNNGVVQGVCLSTKSDVGNGAWGSAAVASKQAMTCHSAARHVDALAAACKIKVCESSHAAALAPPDSHRAWTEPFSSSSLFFPGKSPIFLSAWPIMMVQFLQSHGTRKLCPAAGRVEFFSNIFLTTIVHFQLEITSFFQPILLMSLSVFAKFVSTLGSLTLSFLQLGHVPPNDRCTPAAEGLVLFAVVVSPMTPKKPCTPRLGFRSLVYLIWRFRPAPTSLMMDRGRGVLATSEARGYLPQAPIPTHPIPKLENFFSLVFITSFCGNICRIFLTIGAGRRDTRDLMLRAQR